LFQTANITTASKHLKHQTSVWKKNSSFELSNKTQTTRKNKENCIFC